MFKQITWYFLACTYVTLFGAFERTVLGAGEPFGQMCLLYHSEALLSQNSDQEKTQLKELEIWAKNRLKDETLNYFERVYLEGFLAWRRRDLMEAGNAWTKFLALQPEEMTPQIIRQREEVEEYRQVVWMELYGDEINSKSALIPSENGISEAIPLPKKIPSPTVAFSPSSKSPTPISVEEIIRKAGQAKDDGQMERSLRLYELALKLDPQSEGIKLELAKIRDEMNEPLRQR